MPRKQGNVTRKNARIRRSGRQLGGTTHFTAETRHFAEAVTNPFSDGAIGAMIPDQWSPPSIPAMDRLTIDFDPTVLSNIFAALPQNPVTAVVDGMFFAIVPRSLAVGWLAQKNIETLSTEPALYDDLCQILPLTETFTSEDSEPLAHMYCLFFCMLGTSTNLLAPTFLAIDIDNLDYAAGFNCIPFSRFSAIAESASGGRIVGAGLKVISDEAAIETGGTAYGGWMPLEDMFNAAVVAKGLVPAIPSPDVVMAQNYEEPQRLTRQLHYDEPLIHISNSNSNPRSQCSQPSMEMIDRPTGNNRRHRRNHRMRGRRLRDITTVGATNVQDSLRYRHTFKGVDGVTVRYSPLQSSTQETFQPVYEDGLFDAYDFPGVPGDGRNTNVGIGVGTHDLIGASDYVPCVIWRYNNNTDVYSLRLEARVHLQAEPDGSCPFMTSTVVPDPNYTHLQLLLENKDAFPVVTKGQSFASFMAGVRKAVSAVDLGIKGARDVIGHVTKIAGLFG
jgi:hypothetical protein